MIWNNDVKPIKVNRYEYVSHNQHGCRYREIGYKYLKVLRLEVKIDENDEGGLNTLILISDALNVPVRFDFEKPQKAYIEIVSAEQLKRFLT